MTGEEAPMHLRRHDWAECPTCGSRLWYGLKEETDGWTVYYECSECTFETYLGRVAMADVESRDDVTKRAESMAEEL